MEGERRENLKTGGGVLVLPTPVVTWRRLRLARYPLMIGCSLSSSLVCLHHLKTYSKMSITRYKIAVVNTSVGHFARCHCRPGVCNKLMTVYAARYPLMIGCSFSSTLSSV